MTAEEAYARAEAAAADARVKALAPCVIDTLNIWARFIYGPLLEDRVRRLVDLSQRDARLHRGDAPRTRFARRETHAALLRAVPQPRQPGDARRRALALGGAERVEPPGLRVGWARADITPPKPVPPEMRSSAKSGSAAIAFWLAMTASCQRPTRA